MDASLGTIESEGFGDGNHGEFAIIGTSANSIEFDGISNPVRFLSQHQGKMGKLSTKERMLPLLNKKGRLHFHNRYR